MIELNVWFLPIENVHWSISYFLMFQLNEAYDEVDEQRGNVSAWKRRTHKAQGEMNDVRYQLIFFIYTFSGHCEVEGAIEILKKNSTFFPLQSGRLMSTF